MKKVLVVNAGSSTIKWKLFTKDNLDVLAEGVADRIFVDGLIETKFNGKKHKRDVSLNSHIEASKEIVKDLETLKIIDNISDVQNIGYRVVQGGTVFYQSIVLDEKAINIIEDFSPLAPLHNPGAVQAIKAFSSIFKDAIGTATFDTAFHTTISEVNSTYPIEQKLAKELKIKKYGMHGTSHKFITQKLEKILGKDKVTFVNLHIGNGASICAIKDSRSIDTSMGMSPLAGIMMGTRSGDIDPSIHAYVYKQKGIKPEEFERILNKDSGLKGVSSISQDMRDILEEIEKGNKQAIFTLDLYCQKIIDYTSIYLNKIGGKSDAIVFTAGVGENGSLMRKKVIDGLNILGIEIDDERNKKRNEDVILISSNSSKVPVYVIATDEEIMIARDNLEIANN
ncbi:acetate/propionate family kinase [Candidatus Mycoplasma mahonii]|uniref:acetate/propionate family kinase n=1 Tax=Candidatus Mycoplasma mahonii TaxID=3004105 RepID=UPI0026E9E25C|nr:acetate/propionate family kinase [Candidatus Mycoplasma mahonii]WKX02598.1 acetate/propionate family kinase [Candidatus Mycoplasma mahonii]